MTFKHPNRIWLAALIVGWSIDLLFWGTLANGISFFVFTLLAAAAGIFLAAGEGARPHPRSLWLLAPVLFFGLMTAVRLEPLITLLNVGITLLVLMLAALTLRSGAWPLFSLSDYVVGGLQLMLSAISKPLIFFGNWARAAVARKAEAGSQPAPKTPNPAWGFVRGLLIAAPIVLVMAALLAAADPVFSKLITGLFSNFKVDNLAEWAFRVFYILVLAFIFMGVYLHSLTNSQEIRLLGVEKPWLPPFLGWIEAVVVLACVDLLFAFFVGLQFKYLFGGQANITSQGFTYADYARRGFTELVAVAVLSLMLFLGLNSATRRQSTSQQRSFTGLSIALVALVAVILISAYQRLQLYEQAYGFSRIRTYTHIFMIWLGVLLVATIALEVLRRSRAFALALAITVLGFGLSANLLNVDAFIVRQNVNRAAHGQTLDMIYLTSLSDDAVPAMIASFNQAGLPAEVKDTLGASLACHVAMQASDLSSQHTTWQSFHFSAYRASQMVQQIGPALAAYPITRKDTEYIQQDWIVSINGVEHSCTVDGPME